ncbi:PGAP1 family protein [Pseudodesulfovibrio profundus]|uniref:PGAP1 family protein n=1 Tax=Pseudodesulfovibrio profundus TaxID=57320 RepID=A0A2C8F930_9BACT|nr:alpha/beta fold hydrolase [Pseudodesulfovibrio profundus]SOB58375.1 PGAP1 family protein [Pseudodesulfovibrio profundus]
MMETIVILLLFLAVAYPALRYLIFILSNRQSGELPEVRRQLGGLFKPVMRGAATAGLADLMVLPTYPLGIMGGREPMGSGTPILLVHGLFHNSSAWLVMKQRLRKAGYENLHTYQYNSFTGEFPQAVDGLQRKLDSLLQQSPSRKVILVGHSLGGLVIRAAVGNPRFWGKIAGMVALGTPHGGSDLARFGGNRMARGLIPGREIMTMADGAPQPDCPKLAIFNPVDDFVFPLHTLLPPEGWSKKVCSPMGHVWMLYSKEIADMLIDFLSEVLEEENREAAS